MCQQLVCGQIARLAPIEDGFGDVRSEIAEANEPREIGGAHPLPFGQYGKRNVVAVEQSGIEPARLNQQLNKPRIGFGCRKWVGAIDPHRDLPPSAPYPYRYGQDLGFVVDRARQWRSNID